MIEKSGKKWVKRLDLRGWERSLLFPRLYFSVSVAVSSSIHIPKVPYLFIERRKIMGRDGKRRSAIMTQKYCNEPFPTTCFE